MSVQLYIVGAGKMATAFASGLVRKGLYHQDELMACDISENARIAFTKNTGGVPCEASFGPAFSQSPVILLAVKPQVAESVIHSFPAMRNDALVISICAGLAIAKLSQWLGTNRVIRVMPNTPLMVGCGASCFALGSAATHEDGALAEKLLGALGIAHQVDEAQLDAVTALSGSGPAYFFEMIQAMTLAGIQAGLPQDLSLELSIQTMAGSAKMLQQKMGTPEELRIAVTSPHGTTEAGLNVLNQADFRDIINRVVDAARIRSIELGQGK